MLDGEISNCVDILQGVAEVCPPSPNLFKVRIHDMVVAVEAARQGVTVGGRCGVGIEVCGWFRGNMRNTRRIAETNREMH